jgi:hypothetical protein
MREGIMDIYTSIRFMVAGLAVAIVVIAFGVVKNWKKK